MDELDNHPKKIGIVAAYHIDPDVRKNAVADALDVSYEYVRQLFSDMDRPDGRHRVTDREWETAQDRRVLGSMHKRLRDVGAFEDTEDNSGGGNNEPEPQGNAEREATEDVVPIPVGELDEEILRLKHHEESAAHGDGEREYIAASAREFLESVRARA